MDSLNNASKFGGDAWSELQAFKTRQINRREKLNRHKDLINGIATNQTYPQALSTAPSCSSNHNPTLDGNHASSSRANRTYPSPVYNDVQQSPPSESYPNQYNSSHANDSTNSSSINNKSTGSMLDSQNSKSLSLFTDIEKSSTNNNNLFDPEVVECLLLLKLCDVALKLPIDSRSLQRSICKVRGLGSTPQSLIENLLEKFAHQELITIEEPSANLMNKRKKNLNFIGGEPDEDTCIYVVSADHTKLVEFDKTIGSSDSIRALLLEHKSDDFNNDNNFKRLPYGAQSCLPLQTIDAIDQVPSNLVPSIENNLLNIFSDSSQQIRISNGGDQTIATHPNHQRKTSTSHLYPRRPILGDDIESLLSLSSTRERESKKLGEELLELLSKPTAKERNLLERFRSADGYQVQEFCPKGTKDECRRYIRETQACNKLHFKKIIAKHTEESLGDCSFLNTCFHMDSCKYVHYEVDYDVHQRKSQSKKNQALDATKFGTTDKSRIETRLPGTSYKTTNGSGLDEVDSKQVSIVSSKNVSNDKYTLSEEEKVRIEIRNRKRFKTVLNPPQWIQCDLRYFDMCLLGKFSVIMADPPWDIHMELPYGTMSDEEMRKLNIPSLQDEGLIFLWVTGRAMELGRECLALWGYDRCDEIIWVKTNQLQRIIRTGRTGHWLNHGKEHCLVGIKGNPKDINRGLDCDIIVAEVRATSHKPDEIYGIIERLSPGTRKIELFGRAHNVQPNWITLGNQLNGVKLIEPDLIEAFKKANLPYETSDQIA